MLERVGKYIIEASIAAGGMAEIFKARTEGPGELEKVLAIKRLLPRYAANQSFVDMLVNEARLTVQLNHKNICQIFDLEQHEKTYFIAMEYVHGRDLTRLIQRFKEDGELMPLELVLFIAQEVCSGLSYAHRKRDARGRDLLIVHRDISPQNVLISFEGEVKVIDFGIAKAAHHASASETGEIKGKFQYMSPEQARGDSLDQRTDVFSVGAVLYEMATGKQIYGQENDEMRLMQLARRCQIPRPSQHVAGIPERLEKIILKATARDIRQRFQTAQELQIALSHYMYSLGKPCDDLRLSQVMRHLFEEDRTASESKLFNINAMDAGADSGSLRREDFEKSDHSVISRYPEIEELASAEFLALSEEIPLTSLPDNASPQEVFDFESAATIAEQPVFDPAKYRAKREAENEINIPTNPERPAFDPAKYRAMRDAEREIDVPTLVKRPRPNFAKPQQTSSKRAALPEMPRAPSLELDRSNYENATRIEMATFRAKKKKSPGQGLSQTGWVLVGVIGGLLVLGLIVGIISLLG